MKKTLKVLLAVVITPIALFLILTLLLVTLGEWKSKRRSTPSKETGVLLLLISRMR